MQIKTCVSIVLAISVIILIIPILAYSTHRNSAQMPVISLIQAYNFTRIIAFGDLHGDYDALISVLAISDWKKTDILITTGDTIDRGDDTIKILDFFIENANQNIKHISGNHEEMNLIGDLRYVSKGDFRSFRGENSRKSAFEETGKYGNYLKNKKIIERIGDVIFLHGGLSKEIASKYKSIDEINRLYRENNYDQKVLYGTNGPLWYRGYANLNEDEICQDLYDTLDILNANIMVMGHTIFESITPKCNNKAIFIDTGMSKALYGRVSALEILQQEGKTVKIEAVYPNKRKRIFDLNNKW